LLQSLNEKNEHFHISPAGELEVASVPYVTGDEVIEYGKVLFRLDEWDEKYFPHVLEI